MKLGVVQVMARHGWVSHSMVIEGAQLGVACGGSNAPMAGDFNKISPKPQGQVIIWLSPLRRQQSAQRSNIEMEVFTVLGAKGRQICSY